MSQYYTDLCWLDGHLKLGRLTVMLALSRHADDDGVTCPSQQQLALETRLTDRQVRRLITELVKTDHLKVIRSGDGRGNTTRYQLFPRHEKVDIFDTKADILSAFSDGVAGEKVDIFDIDDQVKVDIYDTKADKMSTFTSHADTRARLGRLGRSLSTTEKRKKPTYPPKPSQKPPRTEAQQLAFELLTDGEVGVIHRVADDLARKLPLPDIYRVVDRWLPERERDVGTGALVTRLRELQPSSAETITLSNGFRSSDLFQRHRLPDEMVSRPMDRRYNRPEDYTGPDIADPDPDDDPLRWRAEMNRARLAAEKDEQP